MEQFLKSRESSNTYIIILNVTEFTTTSESSFEVFMKIEPSQKIEFFNYFNMTEKSQQRLNVDLAEINDKFNLNDESLTINQVKQEINKDVDSYDAFEAFQQNIKEEIIVDTIESFADSHDEKKYALSYNDESNKEKKLKKIVNKNMDVSEKSSHLLRIKTVCRKDLGKRLRFYCPKCDCLQEKLPYRSKCQTCKSRFYFQCSYCTNRYENETSALQHMYDESQYLSNRCPYCSKTCTSNRVLKSHIMFAHLAIKPDDFYKCNNCNLVKKTSEALLLHCQKHCFKKINKRTCEYCEFECKDQSTLTLHVDQTHLNKDGQSKFSCNKCGKMFKFLASYKRHEKLYNESGAQRYTLRCQCGYETEWKCAMHQHTISFGHPAIQEEQK